MKTLVRLLAAALMFSPLAAAAAEPPVEVMIVGVFHFANPGRDQFNAQVDDVLTPRRQAEIQAITDRLARFRPTVVGAEWPAAVVAERYAAFTAGALAPSRNEVVQLGFRLARQTNARIVGLDAPGDFPFGPVQAYAEKHGQTAPVAAAMAQGKAEVEALERSMKDKGIAAALRRSNEPAKIASDHDVYRQLLRVGGGDEQPGAELMAAWQRRNSLICAKLIQAAKPGDRMVVFFGAGHSFLLRQCVLETPGFRLVEPNAWLPRR